MEIITKLMDVEESFLTDYGVINIAGKEYLISDLEKDFEKSKEQVINFNFDKNNGCFVLSLKKDGNIVKKPYICPCKCKMHILRSN